MNSISPLTAYLQRGSYKTRGIPHSSFESLCEEIFGLSLPTCIALDGPTNAGKTSMAKMMVAFLHQRGVPTVHISHDLFLTDRTARRELTEAALAGSLDIADYSTLAWEQDQYRESIETARQTAAQTDKLITLTLPNVYNRQTGWKDWSYDVMVYPGSVIISEGVGVQMYHHDLFDMTVRMDTHEDNTALLRRLLQREQQKPTDAQLDDIFLRRRFNAVDGPHADFLRDHSPSANFVIDTSDFQRMVLYEKLLN